MENSYQPAGCEHKLPNGLSAWVFQSEESGSGPDNMYFDVHVCVCKLCGTVRVGGFRQDKQGKLNKFSEEIDLHAAEAIDAIVKYANYIHGEEVWGRLKAQPAPRWVKGAKGFPVMKRVVAKFKHYDDPLRDWVVGYASSSTGETITFDWGVSSITLDINHERWDLLYWLDEQPAAGREEDAVAFAEWILKNDLEATFNDKGKSWVDFRLPRGKNKFTTAELYKLFKQHNP